MTTTFLVVMGVSGAGKSTVAQRLADQLGWTMAEGDEFHSEANIAKMESGTPLDDGDRGPWLRSIRDWLAQSAADGSSAVVTCSALKRSYRDILRDSAADVRFVHLSGRRAVIGERIGTRSGHFMPSSLLDSQFGALEPLESDEPGTTVDVDARPEQITDQVLRDLRLPGEASA